MKLTSISDHSDLLQQLLMSMSERWKLHRKRVEFGRQPLNISMFITAKLVDGEWVILEEPKKASYDLTYPYDFNLYSEDIEEYQTAKSNILFEGFEVNQKDVSKLENIICITKNNIQLTFFNKEKSVFLDELYTNKTKEIFSIEDLVKYNLTLTTTAKKLIGL